MSNCAKVFKSKRDAEVYKREKLVGWPEAQVVKFNLVSPDNETVAKWVIVAGNRFFSEGGYFV